MTNPSLGFLGAAAALALFGGLHLEVSSGLAHDGLAPNDARVVTGTSLAGAAVNRDAKGDRNEAGTTIAERRTIVFHHPDLQSTTVALRVWETVNAKNRAPGQPLKGQKPAAEKPKTAIACEGPVSVLTEVAKQIEARRCVT